MYPTLYEAFVDLFGLHIGLFKIVMTFGFFVAMAFLAANWAMIKELKRKEDEGIIKPFMKKIKAANPLSEYITNAFIGFLIGFKIVYMFLHFPEVSANPQAFLLSSKGSMIWGVAVALAFIAFKYYQFKKYPDLLTDKEIEFHPYQMMGNLTMIAAAAGFIGAKLFHHLETFDEFIKDPMQALSEPFSGLTFYGGLICGGAAVLWYAKKHGVNWKIMLDVGAPAMMLAYGVGRMGCHISGDGDWGIENLNPKPGWMSWLPDWAWAYDYPNNVLGKVLENPVYPTPMYEVIMALALFAVIWTLRKRIKVAGVLFGVYLIFAGIERYFIEKIRVNAKYHAFGIEFTQATMISIVFIVLGLVGIILLHRSSKSQAETN